MLTPQGAQGTSAGKDEEVMQRGQVYQLCLPALTPSCAAFLAAGRN